MFNNLIESGSHRRELARKSRFFVGTLGLYVLLLAASGVVSVIAFDARLERQTLELTWILMPPPDADAPPAHVDEPRPRGGGTKSNSNPVTERVAPVERLHDSRHPPDAISTVPNAHREMPRAGVVAFTGRDVDPLAGGGPVGPAGAHPAGPVMRERAPVRIVETDDLPPPTPAPTPAPTPKRPGVLRVSSVIISGKVLAKPAPPYPRIAVVTRTTGSVNVEILIDEQGRVASARAADGPAMLRAAAEQAARQARFTPTVLGGQPVKVSGVITYNFVLN